MSKVFLTNGQVIDITQEESLKLAKLIMFLPDWRSIGIRGRKFTVKDIDLKKGREYRNPQMKLFESKREKNKHIDLG